MPSVRDEIEEARRDGYLQALTYAKQFLEDPTKIDAITREMKRVKRGGVVPKFA